MRVHNPIRVAALIIVAITSGFIMWMRWKETMILAAPDWCARAINAEKLANPRQLSSFETCKDLLIKQVSSIALNSHIDAGVIALCLLVLIVIVIAGGKVSFNVSKTGAAANIGEAESIPVSVVNPPSEPVPTAPTTPAPPPQFTPPPGGQL